MTSSTLVTTTIPGLAVLWIYQQCFSGYTSTCPAPESCSDYAIRARCLVSVYYDSIGPEQVGSEAALAIEVALFGIAAAFA